MNERIKELAEQAWRAASDEVAHLIRVHNRSYSQDEITDIFEIKFAELIVRECVEVCGSVAAVRAGYHDADGRDTADSCGDQIKEHFGIES